MALDVQAILNEEKHNLESAGENTYQTTLQAPEQQIKVTQDDTYYSVSIIATDEAGNQTIDNSTILKVESNFSFDVIIAGADGEEFGIADMANNIDVDVSLEPNSGNNDSKNTFELVIDCDSWDANTFAYGNRIFIPETEYGGIIGVINSVTASNMVYIKGQTWRGILHNKIMEPPEGEAYLYLSGDLNQILGEVVKDKFGGIFYATDDLTGITVEEWQVERYKSVYQVFVKLLSQYGMKLCIKYNQERKAVELSAVPIVDYSNELEYSQDSKVDFDITDNRIGVNHLICGGQGEGADRLILHLYVQEDGTIGDIPFYTGINEITQFYDYRNAENEEELYESGVEKLKELQNFKSFSMSVDNIDLELCDIVGGREYITDTELQKPVIQKIFKKDDDGVSIEYKLKGEN